MIQEKSRPRALVGTVIKPSGPKTVMIAVPRLVRHPRYEKVMRRVTRLWVHDEQSQCRQGDLVEVQLSRPISRTKRWRVVRVIKSAPQTGAGGVSA
jgi:small subunit ribosomal protein S17